MDYKELNDYELVYQVRENDEVAYGILIDKYAPHIRKMANKYLKKNKNVGLEFDDLYQEGMVGLIKALNDFNAKDSIFFTYVTLCAKREMDRIIKYHTRKKMMALNEYVSFSKCINNDPDFLVEDVIASDFNLEKEFEYEESRKKLLDIKFDYDLIDSSILELKINGFSTREIANLLDLTYKAVDYRMRKIRKKIVNFSC